PGTGKTLLARDVHAHASKSGKRSLYLCWTRALATALRAEGVESARTVRETAAALLSEADIPMQGGASPSTWTNETWDLATLQAAADAVPSATTRCDAVVVDEAQDLSANDWELVRALAGDGALWAFGDSGQAFWPERAVPAGLFPASLELRSRYRCPDTLAAFADLYRSDAPAAPPETADLTTVLRLVRAPSPSAVADRVARELDKALGDGARPQDVAILSLAGQSRSKLCTTSQIGRTSVVRADDPTAPSHVVADTFLRFKGLERPWIIVVELGLAQSRAQYAVRMHIALTRATVGGVVVATAEEIGADARLAALLASRAAPGTDP
ncbi:MAG TPA: AAA family ATPase, partial [Polyangiaceae bacterium]